MLDEVLWVNNIIKYIKQKYNPLSIILYGSYANNNNNLNSDFDALVISCNHEQFHDTSFVNGIQLDVFVYPELYFKDDYDCNRFIQISDGKIILDTDSVGKTLKNHVLLYLKNHSKKTNAEIQDDVKWCLKMVERVKRYDTEGMFRWHLVLTESLEIFCNVVQQYYQGPKKTLEWLEEKYPQAFVQYKKALKKFDLDSLENWIMFIKKVNDKSRGI